MPKKKLKKVLPSYEKIQKQRFLRIFGTLIHKREIWSLSRKRVVAGVFIGIFVAALPMPFQMLLSTLLAILFGANLPISFLLIFISNPITMPPIFYLEYQIGKLLINPQNPIEFNFESMYDNFGEIAFALWSGAFVVGIFCAVFCSIIINFLWIYTVRKNRKRSYER